MLLPNKPSRSLRSSSKRVLTFLFKEHCDYSSVRIFIFNFLLLFLILIFRYKFLTCIVINLCFIMIYDVLIHKIFGLSCKCCWTKVSITLFTGRRFALLLAIMICLRFIFLNLQMILRSSIQNCPQIQVW